MFGIHGAGIYPTEGLIGTFNADAGAVVAFQPLTADETATSGTAAADASHTISDAEAVASFVQTPTAAALRFPLGVALAAASAGKPVRSMLWGATKVLVKNVGAASISLSVNDLLARVAGQAYLVPLYQPISAGTSLGISNRAANACAIVTKAITITAGSTSEVQAWVFPQAAPRLFSWTQHFSGAAPATITAAPFWVATGPGIITAVGLGVATGGNAGKLDLDILKNATSVMTTKPVIDEDCIDPVHTLAAVTTPAAGVGPGTEGVYGTIKTDGTAAFVDKDVFTFTLTNTSSFVGTHVHLQVDFLLF